MPPDFHPKQITRYEASHLSELQGDVSQTAIEYSLKVIAPAGFSNGDTIHDNATGSGAVTETIMERIPKEINVIIEASDINPQFVEGCKALAASNGWTNINCSVTSATDLSRFKDNMFDYSFTSFAIQEVGDHSRAAKEIHRTLKLGGSAMASIWTCMPHVKALQHAHWLTRGKEGPMPVSLPLERFDKNDLIQTLEAGGFKRDDIQILDKDCYLKIPDLQRWAQLAWSYLGHTSSGWSQSDEDKWEESINDIVEQLRSGDDVSKNEKGETVLRMIACIAIARK